MGSVLTDHEIELILADPKRLSMCDVAKLKGAGKRKRAARWKSAVEVIGQSGRRYRIVARCNMLQETDFSVILALRKTGDKQLNLIRCNGHHGMHRNRLERTMVPANTCHIHRLTERYQRFRHVSGEAFAEATNEYRSFRGAVDFLAQSFGCHVHDDPYGGGLFRNAE